MIKVLVVDDHQLVRVGTTRLLEDQPGITIIGEAGSGEQAIDLVRSLQPDVVLMDIQMPGIGGLEATRRCLRIKPEVKIIALTMHEAEPFPTRLFVAGGRGYLTKQTDPVEMV